MQINEQTGLYGNYGIWHVPFWQTKKFIVAVKISLFIAVLLLMSFLFYLYRRYQQKKNQTAWNQALHDINQLKSDQMVHADHGKEFYASLSSILKKYFHNRFHYDSIGKTDAEIIELLEKDSVHAPIVQNVKEILHGGIFVKFANAQAAQERIDQDYDRAISIITLTIPDKK